MGREEWKKQGGRSGAVRCQLAGGSGGHGCGCVVPGGMGSWQEESVGRAQAGRKERGPGGPRGKEPPHGPARGGRGAGRAAPTSVRAASALSSFQGFVIFWLLPPTPRGLCLARPEEAGGVCTAGSQGRSAEGGPGLQPVSRLWLGSRHSPFRLPGANSPGWGGG